MSVLIARSGVFSLLLLVAGIPATGAIQSAPAVEALAFAGRGDRVEFTITSSEAVEYSSFELDGPRVVLDFHGAENRLGFDSRWVGMGGVQRVRASTFVNDAREVTRVVFDLEEATPYEIERVNDGLIAVSFGEFSDASSEAGVAAETGIDTTSRMIAAEERSTEPAPEAVVSTETTEVVEPHVVAAVVAEVMPVDIVNVAHDRGVAGPEAGEVVDETLPRRASAAPAPEAAPADAVTTPVAEESTPEAGLFMPSPLGEPIVTLGQVQTPAPIASPAAPAPAVSRLPVVNVQLPSNPGTVGAPPPAPSPFLAQQAVVPPTATEYTGEIVSFNLVGSDLRDFFRVISELSGLNIILDDGVTGELTLVLNDVPWDQALDIVLRTNSLGYELMGNVLRIAPISILQAEEAGERQLREDQALNVPLETRPFILSYTTGEAVSPLVTPLLSARGTIVNDPRRNALIVTDVPARFDRIDSMISFLDTPAQQVEIEARLLFASKRFSREMGSQFGIVVGNNSQNTFGGAGVTPSPFSRTPAPNLTIGDGGSSGGGAMPLVADFPSSATSGFSFLLGAGSDIILDEIITLAEANGTAKLLSRPRVVTQNNQPATVSQGTQIPVQTNVNNTVSVQFIPFNLSLTVTPQITDAGTILLNAQIENSSPDFARSIQGVPSVTTQQAATQVLIPDGGTAVVGGILVDDDSVNVAQIPGLGDIPILGRLFKSTSTVKTTNELLFFITARIKPADPLQFLAGSAEDESAFFGAAGQ
jgi:type IV pilus assembly protein PilQ